MKNDKLFDFAFLKNSHIKYLHFDGDNTDIYYVMFVKEPNIKTRFENQDYNPIASDIGLYSELFIKELYNIEPKIHTGTDYVSWKRMSMMERLKFIQEKRIYSRSILDLINNIRNIRNHKSHELIDINEDLAKTKIEQFHDVLAYFYNIYEAKLNEREPYFNQDIQFSANHQDHCFKRRKTYSELLRAKQNRKIKQNISHSKSKSAYKKPHAKYKRNNLNAKKDYLADSQKNTKEQPKHPIETVMPTISPNSSPAPTIVNSEPPREKYYSVSTHSETESDNEWSMAKIKKYALWAVEIIIGLSLISGLFPRGSSSSAPSDSETKTEESSSSLYEKRDEPSLAGKIYILSLRIDKKVDSINGEDKDSDTLPNPILNKELYFVTDPKKGENRAVLLHNKVDIFKISKDHKDFDKYYQKLPKKEQLTYQYKDRTFKTKLSINGWKEEDGFKVGEINLTDAAQTRLLDFWNNMFAKVYLRSEEYNIENNGEISFTSDDFTNREGKDIKATYKYLIDLSPVDRNSL